jgi:hypothetical protein
MCKQDEARHTQQHRDTLDPYHSFTSLSHLFTSLSSFYLSLAASLLKLYKKRNCYNQLLKSRGSRELVRGVKLAPYFTLDNQGVPFFTLLWIDDPQTCRPTHRVYDRLSISRCCEGAQAGEADLS